MAVRILWLILEVLLLIDIVQIIGPCYCIMSIIVPFFSINVKKLLLNS